MSTSNLAVVDGGSAAAKRALTLHRIESATKSILERHHS